MMTPPRIVLFSVGILFALIAVLLGVSWSDDPPPLDADILPVSMAVKHGDNGYPILQAALEGFTGVSDSERLKALTADADDEEWLRTELQTHQQALELFTEAIAHPLIILPRLPPIELRPLGDIRGLSRLLIARGVSKLRHPETRRDGLTDLVRAVRFGRQLAEGGGSGIDFLTALAIQGAALESLRNNSTELRLTSHETQDFLRALGNQRIPREAFVSVLRGEYALLKETYQSPLYSLPWYLGYLSKPNQTLRMAAEQTRMAIDLVQKPVYEKEDWILGKFSPAPGWPLENIEGRSTLEIRFPPLTRIILAAFLSEANFGSTQLLIALSGFERTEGHLPETLGDLEGVWIDSVPVDPFSGEPLRYSKPHRLVFSVGPEREQDPVKSLPAKSEVTRSFLISSRTVP